MAEKTHPPPLTPVLQERASAELYELNKKLQKQLKQDINRQVYNQNVIKHKEDAVVEQIRKVKGRKRGGVQGTPDSDVFLTPKDSPGEAPDTYRGGTCNFPKPAQPSVDRRKNSLYYNLVHLEEDFNSPSSGGSTNNLLEKELAEQDLLFESFHSIIIKEGQEDKKKTTPPPVQPPSQPVKKKKVAIVKPVKKVVKPKIFTKTIKNEYIDCGFDSEYLNLEGDYKRKGMNYGGKGEESMSGRHQDSRDSPVGPSSGASSPSVTWDSVMQDPPISHQCILSPGDSPSASHPTTYYSSPEPLSKQLTSPSPPKSPSIPLQDKHPSPSEQENIVTYDRAVSPVNFLDKISPSVGVLSPEQSNRSSVLDDSFPIIGSLPISPVSQSPIVLRAEVSPPQIKTAPCPTNLYSQPDSQMLNQDLKTETLCTVKTNYFIDASNLTDEAEGDLINNLSVAYITRSAIDFVEPKLVTKEIDDPTYSKELDNLTLCNTVKNSCEIINKDCQNNISISSDQIFDNPLKSLVRHNTFEVETTVCKTHVIINNVNDLSASSNFNHDIYPKTDVVKCMNINTFQTCDVGVQNNQTLFMPLSESKHAQTDEEGQSPDSLTNDYVKPDGVESTIAPENSAKAMVNDSVQTELVLSSISDKTLNSSIHEPSVSDLIDISSSSNCESVVDVTKLIETTMIPDQLIDFSEPITQVTRERVCSGSDGSWSQSEHVESPRIRRKTDEAPILSGAATFTPEVEDKPIIKPKVLNTMTASWTIDMSDSTVSGAENDKRKPERVKSVTSSFGFFVPLSNEPPQTGEIDSQPKKIKEQRRSINEEDTANSSQGSSCGFYIDLRNDFESLDSQISVQSGENESCKPEKKLFSMFIDISDSCSKSSDSASPKSKTSSPFLPTRKARVKNQSVSRCEDPPTSLSSDSGLDMGVGEHPEIVRGKSLFGSNAANTSTSSSSETSKKQSFYMFIEANETKPPNRRKNIPLGLSQSSNRLSWTSENGQSLLEPGSHSRNGQVYKRTLSLNEKSNNVPVEETGMSGPASIDTASVQKTTNSTNGASNRMMSSWHGVVKPSSELSKIIKNSKSKDSSQKDNLSNSISEKCDKEDISSSIKSDDVFDSNASVSSKDENRTFVLDDVSKVAQANSSELEASTTSSHDIVSDLSKDDSETDKIQEASVCSNKTQKSERFSFEADYPPNQINEDTFEQRHRIADDDGYVKLSDMDRIMPSYSRENRKNSRMTRSIPEGSTVFENKILTKSSTSRSLSRLFPHLSSQFHVEPEDLPSNNSLQSSFNPSLEASAEGFVGECSRLGEDLLRMFLEEISPDVVVEVGGRRIKAHKCILSSRCQYFAAMLSGGWVESAGNVISLPGFSYNTVHFALCHIYSGASNVPESINIVELATLADMLCLEGLKEVITYTLKVKYCHFFHKPCSECIVGCVECLPVAAAYGLDEIYRKSLRWISKHFTRVWPTKSFASLPKELHDKCYKQHIVHMNAENILETIMGCEKLEATIPNVRWAQTIFSLNTKLQDTSHKYLTNHFKEVLSSNAFLSLSREDSWTIGRIEDVLLTLADLIQPDQAVHSYGKLHAMVAAITPQTDFKMEFLNLLKKLENRVEDCLIKQAGRAIRTPAWTKLDPVLRKKIQEAACLVFTPGDGKRSTVLNMHQRSLSKTELAGVANSLERKRALLAKSRPTSSKSVPPPNKSKPVVPQSKTVSTKSSSVVGSRLANSKIPSASNVSKPSPRSSAPCQPPAVRQAKSQTTTSSSATPSPLLKSRNNRFAQVKSRYMDPKPDRKESIDSVGRESRSSTRTTTTRNSRNVGSSSDSSRTASPACMRHPHAMSTDSLEAATQPAPSRVSSAPAPRLSKSSLTQPRPRTKPSVGPRSSTFTKPSTK